MTQNHYAMLTIELFKLNSKIKLKCEGKVSNEIKYQLGFTFIELVVAMAIVGVLATIAIPSYIDSVSKSRRNDAKGALLGFANAMERHYTENNSYCDAGGLGGSNSCGGPTFDNGAPGIFSAKSPIDGSATHYNLTIVSGSITDTTYTLAATPTGAQANDKCGTLTLTHTGVRNSSQLTPAECW